LSFKSDNGLAFGDGLPFFHEDFRDGAVVFGFDGHFHFHGLEDDDGGSFFEFVPDLDFDLPNRARDVRLDVCHGEATLAERTEDSKCVDTSMLETDWPSRSKLGGCGVDIFHRGWIA